MLRSLSSWLGLILMVMACPPISWYAYAVLVCVFLLWLFSAAEPKLRSIAITALLIVVVSVIVGSEFFHRGLPPVTGPRDDHVFIIGDSLSSGLGQSPPWPVFLQQATGVQAKNLARPGAGVNDALAMANQITSADHLVLLEIGGNDLLAGIPADKFAMGLEALLMKVCAFGRTVVMFELPLIPSRIGYGQAQRRLAARYHVVLIPKRFLADVLGPSSTSDGMHLSEPGAQKMAALVARVAFSRP
jgi:lysophospholipase L1-like esterase